MSGGPDRDRDAVRGLEREVEALGRRLREAPGTDEGLARALAETHGRLDALRARVRRDELDPAAAERAERAAVAWLNELGSPEQLVDQLLPDPAWAGPRPARPALLRMAAVVLRLRDRRPGARLETLADVRSLRGLTAAFAAALLHTGSTRAAAAANAPRPTPDLGVMLPLRIETRFDTANDAVRILVVPDEPWLSRHDERVSAGEIAMVERYVAAVGGSAPPGPDPPSAWSELVAAAGGARAAWLLRTHVQVGFAGALTVLRPPDEDLRTEPAYPSLVGLPAELHVFLAPAGGGAPVDVLTLHVDPAHLAMDLPDVSDPDDQRWYTHYKKAEKAGLAGTFALPFGADEIEALFVVGIGDEEPLKVFGPHSDAGLLGLMEPGTPTNTVDGAPAASLGSEREWWDRVQSPLEHTDRAISLALTGLPEELHFVGTMQPYHRRWAWSVVQGVWPALFGFAATDVWALHDADAARRWSAHALAPEGPYPTLRLGSQPYGLLPATSLRDWRAADGDPPAEVAIAGAHEAVLGRWVAAAEARGTAAGATIDGLLDRLADTPTAGAYRHRPAIALELWWLILSLTGFTMAWEDLEEAWRKQFPVADELKLHPHRRYGAIGTPVRVELPLVRPEKLSHDEFVDVIKRLMEMARSFPSAFRSMNLLLREHFRRGELDSLLLRLVVRSLQVAIGDVGRAKAGERPPRLEPLGRSTNSDDHLEEWIASVTAADVAAGTPEANACRFVLTAMGDFTWMDEARLERLLRATLDTASHRIDPWFTGVPARRLDDMLYDGNPRMRLGAYGWVDRPRPGSPGPTEAGFIHAPSQAQALTASVLRDRSINDADPARWHMDMTSRTTQGARRIADEIRAGAHFAEGVGREVERIVAVRSDVERLRREFPLRTEHAGRRTCDGRAVLAAPAASLGLDAATLAGLDGLRAALDAYGDLFVIEGAHDVLQRRPEAAAAAMDAAAGLSRPPDLGVLRTDRLGRSVATATALVIAPADPVPEPADPEQRAATSPAALADPAVAAFLVAQLGAPAAWTWLVANAAGDTRTITLDTLALSPADALTLSRTDLERLVVEAATAAGLVEPLPLTAGDDHPGRRKYEAAARLVGLLGRHPADGGAVTTGEPDEASAATAPAVDADLLARYGRVHQTATELRDLLLAEAGLTTPGGEIGTADAAKLMRLTAAARRWGIAPDPEAGAEAAPDPVVAAALRAHELLAQRLKAAPGPPAAAALPREDLMSALAALVTPTAQVAVLSRLRFDALPPLTAAPALDGEWLPIIAAVRAPLARVEAHQLSAGDGPALVAWSTKADDPWQLDAARPQRLVAVWAQEGLGLAAAAPDLALPVAVLDTFTELIPETDQATATVFGFDGPAARPVQAVILAVPPDLEKPLDVETTQAIVADARRLAHARMARAPDLDPAARSLVPTALLPPTGRNAFSFAPWK
jgi:hypothetical protein